MHASDRVHQGQPQSGAVLAAAVIQPTEPTQRVLNLVGGDARSCIGDAKDGLSPRRLERETNFTIAVLERILDQVT